MGGYLGKFGPKRDNWDEGFGTRDRSRNRKEEAPPRPTRPSYPKVVEQELFKEPVQVGKPVIDHPTNDFERYMHSFPVVEAYQGKFAVQYPNGSPVLTFRGHFVYTSRVKSARQIQTDLKTKFDIETKVVYGPGHKWKGQEVPDDIK